MYKSLIMRKVNVCSAFMMLFLAFSFVSCDTEPVDPVLLDNPGGSTGTQGSLSVQFNGEVYTATTIIAAVNNGLLAITGLRGSSGESVSIAFQSPEVRSYTAEEVILTYNPPGSEYQYINFSLSGNSSGTVTVTNIDTVNKTISGTFEFTGWWSNDQEEVEPVVFSNGTFTDVNYVGTIE